MTSIILSRHDVQQASYLEEGPLMPLYLYVNQKSVDDDDKFKHEWQADMSFHIHVNPPFSLTWLLSFWVDMTCSKPATWKGAHWCLCNLQVNQKSVDDDDDDKSKQVTWVVIMNSFEYKQA